MKMRARKLVPVILLLLGFFSLDSALGCVVAADNVLDDKVKVGHYKNKKGFSVVLSKQKSGYRLVYKSPKGYTKWRTYTMFQKGKQSEYFAYEEGWSSGSVHYKGLPGASFFVIK